MNYIIKDRESKLYLGGAGKERYKPEIKEITWGRLNLEFGILMGTYR